MVLLKEYKFGSHPNTFCNFLLKNKYTQVAKRVKEFLQALVQNSLIINITFSA